MEDFLGGDRVGAGDERGLAGGDEVGEVFVAGIAGGWVGGESGDGFPAAALGD